MAIFYPSLDIISKLFTKPTDGEWYLLNFLKDKLSDEYEVFFQSSIAGKFPDVIILHKNHGMMIIEVKDYNMELYDYDENNIMDSWTVITNEGTEQKISSPIKQVNYYKNLFFNEYSLKLHIGNFFESKTYGLINTVVYFHNMENDLIETNDYTCIVGRNNLERFFYNVLSAQKSYYGVNYFGKIRSRYFTDEIYNDIKRILTPSEYFLEKISMRHSFDLDKQKKEYSDFIFLHQGGAYKRKIRGIPGSGKTVTLVYKAINVAKKYPVLFVVFNITLVNKINELLSILSKDKNIRYKVDVIHYNAFVRNYCEKYADVDNEAKCAYGCTKQGKCSEYKNDYETGCKNLCENYVADKYNVWLTTFPYKYPVILIDECQDFRKNWIDSFHKLLDENGEMLIAADERQHVYGIEDNYEKDEDNKDNKKIYTGIGGRWPNFNIPYPYSIKMQFLSKCFKDSFIDSDEMNPYEKETRNNKEDKIFYLYSKKISYKRLFKAIMKYIELMNVNIDDIVVVTFKNKTLRMLNQEFSNNDISTITVTETQKEYKKIFRKIYKDYRRACYEKTSKEKKDLKKEFKNKLKDELHKIRRIYRRFFYSESGKIKLSTIHSFKGWRAKYVVLILDDKNIGNNMDQTYEYNKMIYTAITRAEKSLFIINNDDNDYHDFFSGLDFLDEIPKEIANILPKAKPKPTFKFDLSFLDENLLFPGR